MAPMLLRKAEGMSMGPKLCTVFWCWGCSKQLFLPFLPDSICIGPDLNNALKIFVNPKYASEISHRFTEMLNVLCLVFVFSFIYFYIVGAEKPCITEIMDVHLPIRSPKKSVTPSLHKSSNINSIHSGKGQSRWHWHPKGWWFKGPKVKDIIHSYIVIVWHIFHLLLTVGVYNYSTSVYV